MDRLKALRFVLSAKHFEIEYLLLICKLYFRHFATFKTQLKIMHMEFQFEKRLE
jgi:hypothetical protein